jgi:uncharacterized protein (TIGR03437 family)
MSRILRGLQIHCLALATLPLLSWGATFGTVVPIGGQGSDLALDEARGVLYVANFTANRIEKLSTSDNSIRNSINVAQQPAALALSPDWQYLVVAHYGNSAVPLAPQNLITVIHLADNKQRTLFLNFPPLAVAFGAGGQALVTTTADFRLLDPVSGSISVLGTLNDLVTVALPTPPATFPSQIVQASTVASGDGQVIYGIARVADQAHTIRFGYDVSSRAFFAADCPVTPAEAPRVLSVNQDGSFYTAGAGLFNRSHALVAALPGGTGALNTGSMAIDSAAGVIYGQVPGFVPQTSTSVSGNSAGSTPVLLVMDADNLTVRQKLRLPENLAGRSVLSSGGTMYAISDSGIIVLPLGHLAQAHRVAAAQEDLVFRSGYCLRDPAVQQLSIADPGGGKTDFTLTASSPGIIFTPSRGTTPATVQVEVDLGAFATGTSVAAIQINSASAVNMADPVRVLINNSMPDMRGTFVNAPGVLTDILADPVRDRFYVLRQDKNQVLVFDGETTTQLATLRTGGTPTRMALSSDKRYLLVGHDWSQLAYVYDLDILQPVAPAVFPCGHYPRSIAASGGLTLASCRVDPLAQWLWPAISGCPAPAAMVDSVLLGGGTAKALPTLSTFCNAVAPGTALAPSSNGASILLAMEDGNVMLYDAASNSFTASRKDFPSLQGAYGASSSGQFVVDNNLLNESLVPITKMGNETGASSGVTFADGSGMLTMVPGAGGPGVIERSDLSGSDSIRPTRMAECPLVGSASAPFTRTLAPLANRKSIISLTTSGFTVLPWQYDAAVGPPQLSSVVNAADFTQAVASGGLISVFGNDMGPTNIATNELPVPTALGESCLTLDGSPLPMLYVSPQQVNAQLPFDSEGSGTLVLHTPGGVSDNYNLNISSAAPSVFRSGVAGPDTGIATIVRLSNGQLVTPTNPIHPGDVIVIYATGLGVTTPLVPAGVAAPAKPLAVASDTPVVMLGGVQLDVSYAGLVPGEVGVYQINAAVPHGVPLGMSVALTLTQAGGSTSLNVRVVN